MSNPVTEFEIKFATKLGAAYAIAVNSGTSALHATLVAIDVRGREVIMPALCPAMDAFAIIHAGGIPIFADVDPQTHLVTHETLKGLITPAVKAVICVALHGLPCDIDTIRADRAFDGIYLIEDCAQALLARYKSTYAGVKADFGCFSFEKKKHLTTGSEGGMIITNNADLATKARKFAGIGYKHMTAAAGRTSLSAATYQNPDYERFDTIGLNYRLSEAQAEIGLFKLANIDFVIDLRQQIGVLWCNSIRFGYFQDCNYDAYSSFYSAAYDCNQNWLSLYQRFTEAGGDGFYAMPKLAYQEPALLNFDGLIANGNQTPNAIKLQKRLVLFKTHYTTLAHAKRQCEILKSVL